MKKLFVLMMALVMTPSLVACVGSKQQEEDIVPPSVRDDDATDWTYKNVTQKQIQTISDVLVELEPLYNEAAAVAKANGWEVDQTTAQELNIVYTFTEVGKYGVSDPSEYEDIEDMATIVEQYQEILKAMPDLIGKLSEPYVK